MARSWDERFHFGGQRSDFACCRAGYVDVGREPAGSRSIGEDETRTDAGR
jgi:hypothetical protein